MSKSDHEAEYRQLPLGPKGQDCTAISRKHPTSGAWCGLVAKTLGFGGGLRCPALQRISSPFGSFDQHLPRHPAHMLFDDFAATLQLSLVGKALSGFTRFCSTAQPHLKARKSPAGNQLIFSGYCAISRARRPITDAPFPPTSEKRERRSVHKGSYLAKGGGGRWGRWGGARGPIWARLFASPRRRSVWPAR